MILPFLPPDVGVEIRRLPVVSFIRKIRTTVNAYSILLGLGASLAILWVVQNVPRWQAERWGNAGLWTLLGALLGARLGYVLIQWPYFKPHLFEAFAFWLGGLSWPGAVLGGLLAVGLVAWRWKTGFWRVADGLAPMIPPLVIAAWLGCWLSGVAYGPAAPQGAFWAVPSRDEFGQIAPRFPLQIMAAIFMLVYAFVIELRKARFKHPGEKTVWMLLGLALDLLVFTLLRADPGLFIGPLRLESWAAGLLFLAGLAALLRSILRSRE